MSLKEAACAHEVFIAARLRVKELARKTILNSHQTNLHMASTVLPLLTKLLLHSYETHKTAESQHCNIMQYPTIMVQVLLDSREKQKQNFIPLG